MSNQKKVIYGKKSVTSTLGQRIRKKLIERATWYRSKGEEEKLEEKSDEKPPSLTRAMAGGRKRRNPGTSGKEEGEPAEKRKKEPQVKAVLFCPHTWRRRGRQ